MSNFKVKTQSKKAGIFTLALFTAGVCFSSFASSTESYGPSSNVWIDVVQLSTEARVSVTVPMGYGFAVWGTTDVGGTAAAEAVTSANGNLYLPNVKVKVNTPSGSGSANYELQYTSGALPLENYSTDVREENLDLDPLPREGLPVELQPYIMEQSSSVSHYWQLSSAQPSIADSDFKKYRVVLDGKPFSVDTVKNVGGAAKPVIELDGGIALAAPPDVLTSGYTMAGTANIPSQNHITIDVEVGGRRGQYTQVEQSVHVAQICWEVIPGELPEAP